MPDPPVRPPLRQESTYDTTTTTSTSSGSTLSYPPSAAPTPFNTYIQDPSTLTTQSILDDTAQTPSYDRSYDYDTSQPSEVLYDQSEISIDPSYTTTSSRHHSFNSHQSHTHLLSSPSRVDSSTSVPFSTRPIPAPLLSLRNSTNGNGSDALSTQSSIPITPTPSGAASSGASTSTSTKLIFTESAEQVTHHGERPLNQEQRDKARLQQLGYDQVLGRDYTFWSSLAISTVNIGCLQGVIYGVYGAYSYGGPMMILIAWPVSGFFSLFLVLSLGELASAYPVSGAMASWAWKLARGGIGGERGWGWLMGGTVLGGHIGNALLVSWQITNIIAGTMQMAFDYEPQAWQGVCFYLGVMLICGVVGSTGWGRSHRFWLLCGAYFLAVYLILNVSILTTIVRNPKHAISTEFFNTTGWSSKPYVYILGWQYCTIATGADASAHMAEETQRPARNVPNAMVCSIVVNYVLGYIAMVLLLLAVKSDDIIAISQHNFPFGYILAKAINPTGAIAICSLLIILLVIQVMAQLQASSRFVFALARDNAMPFAESIRWTNKYKQPIIANWVVIALCVPFCLLTIAGKGTLYSVLAVTAASLSFVGYLVPLILYLLSRKDLQTEGRSSWSLRRFSKPSACLGILYGLGVIVTQMFPGRRPVSAQNASWSPLILAGTGLTCLLTWKLYGNKHYSGPIRALTKWETGVEIDLQSALASSRSRPTNGSQSDDTPRARVETVPITSYENKSAEEHGIPHSVVIHPAGGVVPGEESEWTEWTDMTDSRVSSVDVVDVDVDAEDDQRSQVRSGGGRLSSGIGRDSVGRISEEYDEGDKK